MLETTCKCRSDGGAFIDATGDGDGTTGGGHLLLIRGSRNSSIGVHSWLYNKLVRSVWGRVVLGLLYAIVTTGAAVGRLVFSALPSLSELFLAGSDSLQGVVFPIDVKIIPSGKKVVLLRKSIRTSRSDFSNDGFPVQKVDIAAKKHLFLVCSESFVSVPPTCKGVLSTLVASDSTTSHVTCSFISTDF